MHIKKNIILFSIIFLSFKSYSQINPTDQLKYVHSIDAIISTLYSVVSGEKGEQRDWQLYKYLFYKDAKLIATQKDINDNEMVLFMKTNQYITNTAFYFQQNNFYEREIHRVVDKFGNIAQVFSTYESFNDKNSEKSIGRGINSIQLHYDGIRWWIVNIFWTGETPENPIPEKYLP